MSKAHPKAIIEIKEVNGSKKFVCNFNFLDEILLHPEVINRKIVPISITGAFRQGKSFLMGHCLKYLKSKYRSVSSPAHKNVKNSEWLGDPNGPLEGFTWEHGRQPNTKGILMWSDVFVHDHENGEKLAIILIDTQGLFECRSTSDENVKIFGLSTLISSVQIINILGIMDERQIEYLDMATKLTKVIADSGNRNTKAFQELIFLFRDWTDDEIGYGYDGGEIYIKEFLSTNGMEEGKAKNVRESIPASFEKVRCFLLNFPGEIVRKKDYEGEWGKLNKEFVKNLKILIESVFDPKNLKNKTFLGKDVNGEEFREHIASFVRAYQEKTLPEPKDILEMMVDNQMKSLSCQQFNIYEEELNNIVDFSQSDFKGFITKKHKEILAKVVKNFLGADTFDIGENIMLYVENLQDTIEKFFASWSVQVFEKYDYHVKNEELRLKNEKQQKEIEEGNARRQWLNFASDTIRTVGNTASNLGRAYISMRGFQAVGSILRLL